MFAKSNRLAAQALAQGETTKQLTRRLAALGYGLARHQTDWRGKRWRYRTGPIQSSGPVNYFATRADLARYVKQCETVRAWQNELLPIEGELV